MAKRKVKRKTIAKRNKTRKRNKLIKSAWESLGRYERDKREVSYEYFKAQVDYYSSALDNLKSTKAAIKKVLNKQSYVSAEERGIKNFLSGLKKFDEAMDRINELRRTRDERGRFAKLDLKWNSQVNKYVFRGQDGNIYAISIENSPESVEVYAI